jgi:hypothetical protein
VNRLAKLASLVAVTLVVTLASLSSLSPRLAAQTPGGTAKSGDTLKSESVPGKSASANGEAKTAATDTPKNVAKDAKADPATDNDRLIVRNRFAAAITTDFVLTHPKDAKAIGITEDEARFAREFVAFTSEELLKTVDSEGRFWNKDCWYKTTGAHAQIVWALLECGISSTNPVMERAVTALLKLAETRPKAGGETEIFWSEPLKEGIDGFPTRYAAFTLLAMQALANARDREGATQAKPQGVGGTKTQREQELVQSAEDVLKRRQRLKKLLRPEELRIATAIRDSVIRRQGRKALTSGGQQFPAGGWDERFDIELPEVWASMHALTALRAAFELGLDAPPMDTLNLAADFLLSQQLKGNGQPATLSFEDTQIAKNEVVTGRTPRRLTTTARGWTSISDIEKSEATVRVAFEPRYITEGGLGETASAVTALLLARYLAASGDPSARGKPFSAKVDDAIHGGLAWIVGRIDACMDPSYKPSWNGKRLKPTESYPQPMCGGGLEWGSPAVELIAFMTGSFWIDQLEWYRLFVRQKMERWDKGFLGPLRVARLGPPKDQNPGGLPAPEPQKNKDAKDQRSSRNDSGSEHWAANDGVANKRAHDLAPWLDPASETHSGLGHDFENPPVGAHTAMVMLLLKWGLDKTPIGRDMPNQKETTGEGKAGN